MQKSIREERVREDSCQTAFPTEMGQLVHTSCRKVNHQHAPGIFNLHELNACTSWWKNRPESTHRNDSWGMLNYGNKNLYGNKQ